MNVQSSITYNNQHMDTIKAQQLMKGKQNVVYPHNELTQPQKAMEHRYMLLRRQTLKTLY
jgi:hypothetical protein